MKKISCTILIIIFLSTQACSKKSSENNQNIVLWNKPVSIIEQYIQGEWKWVKVSGGFGGPHRVNYINNGSLIIQNGIIKLFGDGNIPMVNDTIKWERGRSGYFADSTYFLLFWSIGNGYPLAWTVNEIKNDTLITRDDGADGQDYYFIKK